LRLIAVEKRFVFSFYKILDLAVNSFFKSRIEEIFIGNTKRTPSQTVEGSYSIKFDVELEAPEERAL
jgi:hypothetical protein